MTLSMRRGHRSLTLPRGCSLARFLRTDGSIQGELFAPTCPKLPRSGPVRSAVWLLTTSNDMGNMMFGIKRGGYVNLYDGRRCLSLPFTGNTKRPLSSCTPSPPPPLKKRKDLLYCPTGLMLFWIQEIRSPWSLLPSSLIMVSEGPRRILTCLYI